MTGVRDYLQNLAADFDLTMGLAGCRSVAEIGPDAHSRRHRARSRCPVRSADQRTSRSLNVAVVVQVDKPEAWNTPTS